MPDRRVSSAPRLALAGNPLPRVTILIAYGVFIFNIGDVLGIEAANMVSKSMFLLAALACVLLRPVTYATMALLGACVFLIVLLGLATPYPQFSWQILLLSLNQIVIIFALLAYKPNRADCDSFLRAAAFFPIACAGLGVLYDVLGLHRVYSVEFGTGLSRFGGSLIPAFLSGLAMCGTFAALQIAVSGKKPAYFAVLAFNIIALLLAGGRMPLAVTLVVSGASLLVSKGITTRTKIYSLIGAVWGLVALLGVFGSTIIGRLASSSDNGRVIMWDYLDTLTSKYPWTGIGWGHQYLSVPREVSIRTGSTSAHNDYVRLLTELGYVGMPLFYLFLTGAILITAMREKHGFNWTLLIAYLGFLTLSWSDNSLAQPSYFPILILGAIVHRRFGAPVAAPPRGAKRWAPRSRRGRPRGPRPVGAASN